MSDTLVGRGLYPFVGASTDASSPTSDPTASTWASKPIPGQRAFETDTLFVYEFDSLTWVKIRVTDPSGNPAGNMVVSNFTAQAESLYYSDQFTNTATADLGDTSTGFCNALSLPFDSLNFTKSGTVTLMTVDIHFVVGGGIIVITEAGAETLAITATSNGNSLGNILVRNSAGTIASATALAAGTYYLYLGD